MMILRSSIPGAIFVAICLSCFVGCAVAPNSPPIPNDSAAFARPDEAWQKDLIQSTPPKYSYADRGAWREGRGVFHVTIDAQTGLVRSVTVKKSTGHPTLDSSAVAAIKQWRFRPGSQRQLDIPVIFEMAKTHGDYIEKVRTLQQHQRQI